MDEESLSLPPFIGHDEKGQRDYHLALRGNSLNPMIDAATDRKSTRLNSSHAR